MESPPVRLAGAPMRDGASAPFFYSIKDILLFFCNGNFAGHPPTFWEEETAISINDSCTPGGEVNVAPSRSFRHNIRNCIGSSTCSLWGSGVALEKKGEVSHIPNGKWIRKNDKWILPNPLIIPKNSLIIRKNSLIILQSVLLFTYYWKEFSYHLCKW